MDQNLFNLNYAKYIAAKLQKIIEEELEFKKKYQEIEKKIRAINQKDYTPDIRRQVLDKKISEEDRELYYTSYNGHKYSKEAFKRLRLELSNTLKEFENDFYN